MKFEVFGPDGKRKFVTEHKENVPSAADLKEMKKAGYTFKMDGKRFVPGK